MTVTAAHELEDGNVVFVGIGLPNLAINLARRTHAPGIQMIYEAGVYGARPLRLPLSIGDPCLATGALKVMSVAETFLYYLQRGLVDVGFLGAAQVDRFGNLNTTVIGDDYARPRVRLPGSGGATEIAWHAKKTILILTQKKNRFPEKLDFVTSVGHYQGGDSRLRLGAPGRGPQRVITDLGVYGFSAESHEMVLEKLHPGVQLEEVRASVGWPIRLAESVGATELPTDAELRLLREELDPQRIYLK